MAPHSSGRYQSFCSATGIHCPTRRTTSARRPTGSASSPRPEGACTEGRARNSIPFAETNTYTQGPSSPALSKQCQHLLIYRTLFDPYNMIVVPDSPNPQKPSVPPLVRESFNRLPHPSVPLPSFVRTHPFHAERLPQLPPLYDARIAAIITSEPEPEDVFGTDRQIWNEEKHTLISLALRGKMYLRSKVMEKVQDLAPGPFKDVRLIQVSPYKYPRGQMLIPRTSLL